MVSRNEKLQRDFLWSSFGGRKKDHLVGWDLECKSKGKEDSG